MRVEAVRRQVSSSGHGRGIAAAAGSQRTVRSQNRGSLRGPRLPAAWRHQRAQRCHPAAATALGVVVAGLFIGGCASSNGAGGAALESPSVPGGLPRYDLNVRIDVERELALVRATVQGMHGPTGFTLAERYAFARVEPRLAGELEAFAADGRELRVERPTPFRWVVDLGDGPEATLRWVVRLDHRVQPEVVQAFDQYEQPYVTADHGMLATAAILLDPEVAELETRVELELPPGWDAIVPWPEEAPGVYLPDRPGLRNDLVAIGAWDRAGGRAGGLQYTVAFAPGQGRLASLAMDSIPRIVETEVELFGGAPQPAYVFLFPRVDEVRGYGGSPKSNAMTMFVSEDLPADQVREGLEHLVAHEYHHTWMRSRCEPVDDLRYVAEGFTDYYAYLVLWRLGTLDDDAYLEHLRSKLAEATRAQRRSGQSLAASGGPSFFAQRDAYQTCYSAGLVMALWTDLALRAEARQAAPGAAPNLDEFLRQFYGSERWLDGRRPTLDDLEELLEEHLGDDLARRHVRAVRDPGGIDWVQLFEAIGVVVGATEAVIEGGPRANFDDEMRVTSLDPAGAGAAVGLRAGDRVTRVNRDYVSSSDALRKAWRSRSPKEELVVHWLRDGEPHRFAGEPPTEVRFDLPESLVVRLKR